MKTLLRSWSSYAAHGLSTNVCFIWLALSIDYEIISTFDEGNLLDVGNEDLRAFSLRWPAGETRRSRLKRFSAVSDGRCSEIAIHRGCGMLHNHARVVSQLVSASTLLLHA